MRIFSFPLASILTSRFYVEFGTPTAWTNAPLEGPRHNLGSLVRLLDFRMDMASGGTWTPRNGQFV